MEIICMDAGRFLDFFGDKMTALCGNQGPIHKYALTVHELSLPLGPAHSRHTVNSDQMLTERQEDYFCYREAPKEGRRVYEE